MTRSLAAGKRVCLEQVGLLRRRPCGAPKVGVHTFELPALRGRHR